MSKIQDLLEGRIEQINYDKLIEDFPWIIEKDCYCILSPDSDGLLCGLFMSNYLNWQVKGFYDGKVMLLEDDISARDCIFLDMEIYRKHVRSVGHHMVLYNKNQMPKNWSNFRKCIQPNNLRNYDGLHDFRLKYPLATIHLLMGIVGSKFKVETPKTAICPLFFTDGTFNVLFKYVENVLNWLYYLRANEQQSPLKDIFENEEYSVFSLMKAMNDFFRERDGISITKERGDRLKISETDGTPFNIIKDESLYKIKDQAKERILKFIKMLSSLTTWEYIEEKWTWERFKLYKFTKKDFAGRNVRLNSGTFNELLIKKPLSWAMTSGKNIEYTLEKPDKLY